MWQIIEPGLLTTVQDAGRPGWARYGIPPSGPMDRISYQAANSLVGNPPDSACLEVTITGPHIIPAHDCLIAVCGADFELHVGPLSVPMWHSVYVRRGFHIRFGVLRKGVRAILAVAGGIDVPLFLDSRSTFLNGAFGGYQGRALQAGDQLVIGKTAINDLAMHAGTSWSKTQRPQYSQTPIIRVVLGPQSDYFSQSAIETLLQNLYIISASSDRMGLRLQGPVVTHKQSTEIVSDGIVTGSIQIPPDGMPIIMMVDHQTTGGYPKIATVIQADIPILAQCMPGDTVRFEALTLEQAHKTLVCP